VWWWRPDDGEDAKAAGSGRALEEEEEEEEEEEDEAPAVLRFTPARARPVLILSSVVEGKKRNTYSNSRDEFSIYG
jgi:hypothetical protein